MKKIRIKYNSYFNEIIQLLILIVSTALNSSGPFHLDLPHTNKIILSDPPKLIIIYYQICVCFIFIGFVLRDISVSTRYISVIIVIIIP